MGKRTRRVVLGLGAAGLGVLGVSAMRCLRTGAEVAWRPDRLHVARAGIPEADRIGAALRQQLGPGALAAAVGTVPDLVGAMAEACPATRAEMLDAAIRAEYSEGRVLVVRRWVVARSEALVAAIT